MTNKQLKPHLGKRIFAGFFDYLLIYTFLFIFLFTYGEPDSEGELSVSGLLAFVPILFWFLMTVGVEQLFGATIGNYGSYSIDRKTWLV